MFKKHIEHLVIVSLKYFFDIDYTFYSHVWVTLLAISALLKICMIHAADNFSDGLLTVKEDAINIKNELIFLKQNWDNSPMREALVNSLRNIKNMVPQKIS